jgi:VWFA-related protein
MLVPKAGKIQWIRFLIGSFCFLGIVVSPQFPQLDCARLSAAQLERSFSLRVDVELVTTEVIVLDKKGKPVRNLKKEDFRLYEDGKQQEISSFDEVTDESGGVSPMNMASLEEGDSRRGKIVLIIFDDSTITSGHIKQSRDSAERFVKEHMRPQDLFAVAAFSNSLKILQNFTTDPDGILQAIAQPAVSSASPLRRQDLSEEQSRGRGRGPSQDPSSIATRHQAENLLRALNSISLSIEHLKGQKSVLLFSESVYFDPSSIDTVYKRTLESAKRSNVVFYTVDPAGLSSGAIGEVQRPAKDRGVSSRSDSALAVFSSGRLLRNSGNLAFAANSMFQQSGGGTGSGSGGGTGGGTSGGGTGGGSSGGGTTGGSTGGGTSGTGGTTGTTTGGNTGASPGGNTRSYPGSDTGAYPGDFNYPDYRNPNVNDPWNNTTSTSLLKSLADETGGLSIYNTNNYDGELDKLDQQLSNYYILGFQSNNPKHDGAFRKLEVKTSVKGLTLRCRKGYLDRRPIDTLASSRQEKTLLQTLAAPEPATQLPVVFRPAYFYDSPRMARVLVLAKIRMEKAEIKKKGSQSGSDLNVMGVAYAEDGSVAARFSEILNITFDRGKEQEFRNSNIVYRNYFKLRPGKYRLKLATSDEANNLGSMEQILEVPALPEHGFAASSLVLADRVSRLPALIQNLHTQLLDDSDPLIYAGMQIAPSVDNRLPSGSAIPVLFKIYDLAGGTGQWKLTAKARLISEKGEESALPAISLNENLSVVNKSEAVVGFTMTFPQLAPGKYKLLIETTGADSAQVATAQTDLELTGN